MPPWFDELAEFLRIPSISADRAHAGDVRRAGGWVCDFIRGAGGDCDLIDVNGQPLAIGELRASGAAASAPTVLCYGHFDVQPPDPLELWESAPFEPEIRGDDLYGRGVADDKGQLYMLLRAARERARAGELAVNLRFVCDGEEEVGGHSIVDFVEADDRGADAAVIFDTTMVGPRLPAFNIGTRGMAYFHLALRTGERDMHSGVFGGGALNATHALVRILNAVIGRDGRLAEPMRAGIIAPTEDELAGWRALPPGAEQLAEQGAHPADSRAAEDFHLRTLAEPALDVNGLASGSPHQMKAVLPVQADANISIRLAPGQDPAQIIPAFEALVRDAVPEGAELAVTLLGSASPGIVSPEAEAIQLGLAAFEHVIGVRPVLTRSGGTLPLVPALAGRGIPTIITGFALPDANIHSPNERLPVQHVDLGSAAAAALFDAFASLGH